MVIQIIKTFLYSYSVYCHFLLISSASVSSLIYLSFIVPIFAWNVPLVSPIFFKSSLFFSILSFSSTSLGSLKKAFLYLLLFSKTLHSVGFIFPFLLYLSLIFFSHLLEKLPQTTILPFLHFLFLGMVLITASCTMSQTSVHSSSGTLSIRSNALNLSDRKSVV